MLSNGQEIALRQLKRIANIEDSSLRITNVEERGVFNEIFIDISFDCSNYKSADNGLNFHDRESVRLQVSADFPYQVPFVTTAHTRFHGFPHVQWGNLLCLYLSPETQWQPSRGMLGLLEQLDKWFEKAAANELDSPGGAIHPPVAYCPIVSPTTVCIHANTPKHNQWPWFGAGILDQRKPNFQRNPNLMEIIGWEELSELTKEKVYVPAILLDFELPFEFPTTVEDLFRCMEKNNVDISQVYLHLILASTRLAYMESLYVIIGVPSRGIVNDKKHRQQHLQVGEIEAIDVERLREIESDYNVVDRYQSQETPDDIQALIDQILPSLLRWRDESSVRWCSIMENRPEIVTRRDDGTAMEWFKGKAVAMWGCGALGGLIAEHLVRAGVKSLTLYDCKKVNPGILVRQNFVENDINEFKSKALRNRLKAIAPHADISIHTEDIISNILNSKYWQENVDVVIDATASLLVRNKLEAVLKDCKRKVPLAAMMISGAAHYGMVVSSPIKYSGGPLDVFRRLGLAAMNRSWLDDWICAFWNAETVEPMRQPEPGCSNPTFVASHADVAGLSARMLNHFASDLVKEGNTEAMGCLLAQDATQKSDAVFHFKPDIVIKNDKIQFRLSANAWRDVHGWIRTGKRERSPNDETGGLLFGQFDEMLGIEWISNVSGPPKDSKFSSSGFICGTDGIHQLNREYRKKSHGVVQYLGIWHSHPVSSVSPSETDHDAIRTIFTNNAEQNTYQLMMIVGNTARSTSKTEIGLYMFEKQILEARKDVIEIGMVGSGRIAAPEIGQIGKSMGLALSGGGSRAVAFHLGTLRALEDLGLLDEIEVISGVSGGSLMTGLIGYSSHDFLEVDKQVIKFLKKGLVWPTFKKLIYPHRCFLLLASFMLVTLPAWTLGAITTILGRFTQLFSGSGYMRAAIAQLRWPIPCWYSRTHLMADAIADVVGNQYCNAPTRKKKSIVFNACELRTGTAFRMSNEQFGSWRHGYASADRIRVADAIAASAAYPQLLPPFDWAVAFSTDSKKKTRVIVTDGGVFENVGTSVMEPGRDPDISAISYMPEIIIASDAGVGQFSGFNLPVSWSSRMIQAFNSVMRRVQDATKKRLHQYVADGQLNRFIYVHLGQIDEKILFKSPNWIDRQQVVDYPTNFSAISDDMILKLPGRSEAITRALITQYLLSD